MDIKLVLMYGSWTEVKNGDILSRKVSVDCNNKQRKLSLDSFRLTPSQIICFVSSVRYELNVHILCRSSLPVHVLLAVPEPERYTNLCFMRLITVLKAQTYWNFPTRPQSVQYDCSLLTSSRLITARSDDDPENFASRGRIINEAMRYFIRCS
jgi:hypothetical protein